MAPPHVAIGNLMCLPAVDTRLHLSALVACNRTRKGASAGHLMRTVPMFASPAVHTRRAASAAQLREKYFGIRQFSSRDLAVQRDEHHPCWKAAHFLPCTRPPDVLRMHRPQRRATFGPSERRDPDFKLCRLEGSAMMRTPLLTPLSATFLNRAGSRHGSPRP